MATPNRQQRDEVNCPNDANAIGNYAGRNQYSRHPGQLTEISFFARIGKLLGTFTSRREDFMLHMIGHALVGLLIGIVAKFLMPGHDPGGIIATALIGMAGGWVGGLLGRLLGWYDEGHPAGFGMSVVGAMVLLLGYRLILR